MMLRLRALTRSSAEDLTVKPLNAAIVLAAAALAISVELTKEVADAGLPVISVIAAFFASGPALGPALCPALGMPLQKRTTSNANAANRSSGRIFHTLTF